MMYMFLHKRILLLLFSRELKSMLQERAKCLGLNISEYLKYLAVKDIIDSETIKNETQFKRH